jgi:hypothetical protein
MMTTMPLVRRAEHADDCVVLAPLFDFRDPAWSTPLEFTKHPVNKPMITPQLKKLIDDD